MAVKPNKQRKTARTSNLTIQSGSGSAAISRTPVNSARAAVKRRRGFGKFDFPYFILVLILVVIGIIMMFSASYAYSYKEYEGDSYHMATRQIFFALLGIVGMLIASYFDYHIFFNKFIVVSMYVLGIGLLVAVLAFGTPIRGATRWIWGFQPSDVVKFILIVTMSFMCVYRARKMRYFVKGLVPPFILLGIICALMMKQPHLSGTVLMIVIAISILFVGGAKTHHMLLVGIVGVVALAIIVFGLMDDGIDYFKDRIVGFIDPFADVGDQTYQTYQSLLTIGSGGFFGVGLGNSRQKYFLPDAHNDFVFAIICEELGFFGGFVILLLFVLLIARGFYIAVKARDKFGMLMAIGISVQIGMQALLNIAVVTNAVPNTGISLPFFSYGGTALIMQLLQVGVLLNISRQSAIE